MSRKIAVIGAGPSGLAAAKAALEQGLHPTVFEAAEVAGGLWRTGTGFTWPGMRTNISKYNCAFSDFPWPGQAPDFPDTTQVERYLLDYARAFKLDPHLETESRVTHLDFKYGQWQLRVNGGAAQGFDGVMVASGIFAKPDSPISRAPWSSRRGPHAIHSAQYRGAEHGRIAVVGGLMSGIEIASHAAQAGSEVVLVSQRPVWLLPRTVRLHGKADVPLDLAINCHNPDAPAPAADPQTRNQQTAARFERLYGNPGDTHSLLRPDDSAPPQIAISDSFLADVKRGAITIKRGRAVAYDNAGRLCLADGETIAVDQTIFSTGYRADLSFLNRRWQNLIDYRPEDKFLPFLSDGSLYHPALPGLYFIGLYRGPYFGVMELQAHCRHASCGHTHETAAGGERRRCRSAAATAGAIVPTAVSTGLCGDGGRAGNPYRCDAKSGSGYADADAGNAGAIPPVGPRCRPHRGLARNCADAAAPGPGMSWQTAGLFQQLAGTWTISRINHDAPVLEGQAVFTPQGGDRLFYREDGVTRFPNGVMAPSYREYIYQSQADGFAVFFVETPPRIFENVRLRPGNGGLTGEANHDCASDRYQSHYDFYPDGSFAIAHQVDGPRKAYRLRTLYRRAGAGRSFGGGAR